MDANEESGRRTVLAVSLETGGTILAGGIGVVLFIISFSLLRSAVSINRKSVAEFVVQAQKDIKELRKSGRLCDRRLAIVIRILQQHQITIPRSIWSDPEQDDRRENPNEYSDDASQGAKPRHRRFGGGTDKQE